MLLTFLCVHTILVYYGSKLSREIQMLIDFNDFLTILSESYLVLYLTQISVYTYFLAARKIQNN